MLILLYILLPFLYLLLISTTEREEDGVVEFNLTGGFLILILYMFTFPLFMFTFMPISIQSIFVRVQWKPIRHTRAMNRAAVESNRSDRR